MPTSRIVAKVFVVNAEGKLLLLRRSSSDVRRPLEWDIPGGHTDDDEYAQEAAARETLEEAGVSVEPRSLRLLTARTEMVRDDLHVVWLFFAAKVDNPAVTISDEHSEYAWLAPSEALTQITYNVQHEALDFIVSNNLLAE